VKRFSLSLSRIAFSLLIYSVLGEHVKDLVISTCPLLMKENQRTESIFLWLNIRIASLVFAMTDDRTCFTKEGAICNIITDTRGLRLSTVVDRRKHLIQSNQDVKHHGEKEMIIYMNLYKSPDRQ
jgi:hypothetical protein